jgi:exo-beta-1,3-glucanase (GH17 family)
MEKFTQSILGVAAITIAAMLVVCDNNGSKAQEKDFRSSMINLKNDLETGLPQQREEPFELRSFRPSIGDDWIGNAVAYGCYRTGQAPGQKGPSNAELLEDLNIIAKHWTLIRVYGADGDTRRILELIADHKLPLKVLQGIWLAPEEDNLDQRKANVGQVLMAIELAQLYSDIVLAIGVGNETQVSWSGHKMNPENLIRYIRAVRNNVSVPVTTADDYLYWNKPESRRLTAETDFVFAHIHPLWNGKTLDRAIGWIDEIYHELQDIHPDRMVVIGETGWATDYSRDKTGPGEQGTLIKGEVGLDAQAAFLIQLNQWVDSNRVTTFLFEAFDESWKGAPEPDEVEKHWGVFNEDRTAKKSFLKYQDRH